MKVVAYSTEKKLCIQVMKYTKFGVIDGRTSLNPHFNYHRQQTIMHNAEIHLNNRASVCSWIFTTVTLKLRISLIVTVDSLSATIWNNEGINHVTNFITQSSNIELMIFTRFNSRSTYSSTKLVCLEKTLCKLIVHADEIRQVNLFYT